MTVSAGSPTPRDEGFWAAVRQAVDTYTVTYEYPDGWVTPDEVSASASPDLIVWAGCAALLSEREAARAVIEAARRFEARLAIPVDPAAEHNVLRRALARFDASRAGEPG